MNIITRAEWGARPPKSRHYIDTPTPELWLHHEAGSSRGAAGMRAIQRFHMDTRKWSDIAYSFAIDPDTCLVYEGRGAGIAGGHTKGRNIISHAICVMGNFDQMQPSPQLLRTIADLIRHGIKQGWWVHFTGGHRDAPGASTACPGRHLYDAIPEIRALAAATVPEEDDMSMYAEQLDRIEAGIAEIKAEQIQQNKRINELRHNERLDAEASGVDPEDIRR